MHRIPVTNINVESSRESARANNNEYDAGESCIRGGLRIVFRQCAVVK